MFTIPAHIKSYLPKAKPLIIGLAGIILLLVIWLVPSVRSYVQAFFVESPSATVSLPLPLSPSPLASTDSSNPHPSPSFSSTPLPTPSPSVAGNEQMQKMQENEAALGALQQQLQQVGNLLSAVVERVNVLQQRVNMPVVVPPLAPLNSPVPGGSSSPSSSGKKPSPINSKVNINTANLEELKKLPGIGQVFAERIIGYRQQNGPYRQIEDLLKVKGIKQHLFDKLKNYLEV